MNRADVLAFMRGHTLAVQASVSGSGTPQSAVVGIAVSRHFEIVFDTVETSRKVTNLRRNPRISFVIGGLVAPDERTVQYEGLADEPTGKALAQAKRLYFGTHPDGRERQQWPGITYVRTRPSWLRYSDYNQDPPLIVEFGFR